MHEVLVNCLFKLAQEKVWLGELTVPLWPWLLTWDVKQQKQKDNSDQSELLGSVSVRVVAHRQQYALIDKSYTTGPILTKHDRNGPTLEALCCVVE